MRGGPVLSVPQTWRRSRSTGELVRAEAPGGRACVYAMVAPPPGGDSPEIAVAEATIAGLAVRLSGFVLEDDDHFDLDGEPVAYRRYGFRVGDVEWSGELWVWGPGLVLTGMVERTLYADYCDVFEEVADSVRLDALGPAA